MAEKAAADEKVGFDFTALYLGFVGGMVLAMFLQNAQERRDREKIRRHLERAMEEVED